MAASTQAKAVNVRYTYMNFTSSPSTSKQQQYLGLVQGLQTSSAFQYRGLGMTQSTSNEGDADLIQMQLTDVTERYDRSGNRLPNTTLQLWFTADNFYLRGFTNVNGQTFYFVEGQYYLPTSFDAAFGYQSGPAGWMTSLGYSGNYNSLTSRAGEGRESLNLNYQAFYDSFYTLAYYNVAATTPNSRVAQSLLVMIQYLSEAARFTDVRGFISARVGDYSNSDATLPLFQQYLESNWARISQFGADITNNPTLSR
ncbi:ribosome-inactivating family protein [Edaphobacter modestus]|uniref:Ribosome inactivating protein n=1 Tax=Edaphobacter modestus TaxID=388466 RepID=A0A4Q7YP66_9BACT|nr:ribosome-inactivating family protein [Edaphobacter modestus]RZU38834.1 ribosome inactivating protein [Edaphobacter modestus]